MLILISKVQQSPTDYIKIWKDTGQKYSLAREWLKVQQNCDDIQNRAKPTVPALEVC